MEIEDRVRVLEDRVAEHDRRMEKIDRRIGATMMLLKFGAKQLVEMDQRIKILINNEIELQERRADMDQKIKVLIDNQVELQHLMAQFLKARGNGHN